MGNSLSDCVEDCLDGYERGLYSQEAAQECISDCLAEFPGENLVLSSKDTDIYDEIMGLGQD